MISRISDQPRVKSGCVQFKYLLLKVLDPDQLLNPIGDYLVSFQSLNWQLLEEEAIPKKTTEQKADKTRRLGRLGSITGAGGASGKKQHIPIELPHEWHTRVVVRVE